VLAEARDELRHRAERDLDAALAELAQARQGTGEAGTQAATRRRRSGQE
jgi:hypothetical protein